MPAAFECHACKAKVIVPEKLVGNRVKCEKCQTLLPVPGTTLPDTPKSKASEAPQRKVVEDDDEDDDLTDRSSTRQDGSGLVMRIVLIGFGGFLLVGTCVGAGFYFLFKRSPDQVAVIGKPAPALVRSNTPIIPPAVPQPITTPTPTAVLKPNWATFIDAPGIQFDSPCTVVKDGFGAFNGSNWVGKYGKQHGFNPWMTDQFYFTVAPLKVPFPGRATEQDFLKLLDGHREYSRHKSGELIAKRMTALDGKICLEIRFRDKGIGVKEEVREHNAFFIASDGKRIAIFDFKTFGVPPDVEIVKGVMESFKFLP